METLRMARYIQILCLSTLNFINQRNVSHIKLSKYCDIDARLSLGNEILQEVSDAKYLGIQIDNKLDWNKHISTVAARGQSKLAFLNRNLDKHCCSYMLMII